jgi:hypothetical protein
MPKYFVTISLEVDIHKSDSIHHIVDSFDFVGQAENTEILDIDFELAEESYMDDEDDSNDEDF